MRSPAILTLVVFLFVGGRGAAQRPLGPDAPDPAPPIVTLTLPVGDVTVEYPTIKIQWCDDVSLDAASRWIKVNGVTKTSSFSYLTGGPPDCIARKYSQSSTVPLTMGANSIEAHICDSWGNCTTEMFTVRRVAPGSSAIALKNFNGTNQERSLCLTTGAGEAAAIQCGDLLVAHGMPAYRTLGRDRSLTLLYGSATAAPRPTVAAWVTLPDSVQQPDSVYAELQINGLKQASAWYYAWGGAQRARQIVLAFVADTFATGIYPFTLAVRNLYNTGPHDQTVNGTLPIVNRRTSPFGAGWWLAGVEKLKLGQASNRILWLGGDGSAAVYDSVAPGVWRRAAGAFRDSLVRFDSSGTWYRRTLRHRVTVTFDVTGLHRRTTNRTGQATAFTWTTDSSLTSIAVAPGVAGADTTYDLVYVSGKLDRITDPVGRVLDATVVSGTLTQLKDPDLGTTSFAYAGNRLTARTNRGGYTTSYAYADSVRVTQVQWPLSSQSDLATTTLTPWDKGGLAVGNPTGRRLAGDTTLSYTEVNGPRTDVSDVAKVWVDRWGAPVRIRDALTNQTVITRDTLTGLIARVQDAVGRIAGMGYDARGSLTFVADSTYEGTDTVQTVTTRYIYGNVKVPDSPTEVRTPVDTTRFHYDTALGLPDTITAQGGHRTVLSYVTSGPRRGLVSQASELEVPVVETTNWTKSPEDLTTQLFYDAWGNDSVVITPTGAQARVERDAYRRVSRTWDPMNHRTDHAYDILNRDTLVTVFDSVSLPTRFVHAPVGTLNSIVAPRGVARHWDYDAASRPIEMTDDVGNTQLQFFGPGGLLDSVQSRNGLRIRNRYDAAGQLTATIYPAMLNLFCVGGQCLGTTITDPGDSLARAYDAAGRLLSTSDTKGSITFTYNREGTVRTQRQLARDENGGVASDFTVRYWYDAGGRRTKFYNGTDTLYYTYGTDGLLSKLKVHWMTGQPADSFLFHWDALGRRDSVTYSLISNPAYVSYGYDRDGHLRMVCSQHTHNPALLTDHFELRVRYPQLDADGLPLQIQHYAGGTDSPGCGSIPGSPHVSEVTNYEYDARHQMRREGVRRYAYDSSGNRVSTRHVLGSLIDSLKYLPNSNRLWKDYASDGSVFKTFEDHPDGSRRAEWPPCPTCNYRFYYYNALGQQIGHMSYLSDGQTEYWIGTMSGCRYDPLGRRVNACNGGAGWLGYDGDNTIRGKTAFPIPHWRYVHGPGIDDPLVAVYQPSQGTYEKYYYLTAGRGRLLAFTEQGGSDRVEEPVYATFGGNEAGAIKASNTFANSRSESPNAPALSFYRNRYYDQQTRRWTQEDPIGVAGGINLYQFAGNNPVVYADPFGLKPCPERLAKLKKKIDLLASRIVEYRSAYRRGVADQDHLDQLQGVRDGLNRDLDAYHRDGCDDDDDFRNLRNQATSLLKAALPAPQLRYYGRGWRGTQSEMADGFCPTVDCVSTPPFAIPGFGIAPGLMPVMPGFGLPTLPPLPTLVPVLVP